MEDTSPSFRSSLGPVLFLAAIFFLNFISRIVLAPLMPAIEKDLGLTHGVAGSFFFIITTGYFVTVLSSGFFSSRWTHRWTIIVSSCAVGLSLLLLSLCRDVWMLRAGLLLLGLCAGLYLPSGIATLTALINPKHWGKAMAIHELGPNLAFVVAPLLSEVLLRWSSWKGVLALLGATSLLLGAGFARLGRVGEFPGQAPSIQAMGSLVRDRAFWIMMALFGLGISGTLGVYAMLPLYLVVEHGMDRNWANTLVAISRTSGVPMSFVAGWATDRLGARRTLAGVFLLSGLTTILLGVGTGAWLIFLVFLQPMLAACFFPAGLAALSSIGAAKARNVAVSLTIPLAFLFGGGMTPMLIGVMGDAGAFPLGIAFTGGLILLGTALSLALKRPQKD